MARSASGDSGGAAWPVANCTSFDGALAPAAVNARSLTKKTPSGAANTVNVWALPAESTAAVCPGAYPASSR